MKGVHLRTSVDTSSGAAAMDHSENVVMYLHLRNGRKPHTRSLHFVASGHGWLYAAACTYSVSVCPGQRRPVTFLSQPAPPVIKKSGSFHRVGPAKGASSLRLLMTWMVSLQLSW